MGIERLEQRYKFLPYLCDFYKTTHSNQYNKDVKYIYSNFVPRMSRIKGIDKVVLVGLELGIPEHCMFKVPDDGLIGTSDEEALGFTYNELDENIMQIKSMEDEIFSIALEQYLPKHMRDRYNSGFHKHFSMHISHGENNYTPVFYNIPINESGKQSMPINNFN